MRLSTAPERDDARALDVLRAALDAGVTLLDTADAYGLDDADVGHNERLIARALAARAGAAVTVVTKGGLTRPGGRWVPDGRAAALAAAARASQARLGGAPLALYVLHAVDPEVPLATSVRALARLREDGVARATGVGNVNRAMLDEALAVDPELAAVEVELSPWRLGAWLGGVIARCEARGLRVLAHRPLGGPAGARRLATDPTVRREAARLGCAPAELALAWLRDLSPVIVPLPGPTTVAHAVSAARAGAVALDDEARRALDRRFDVERAVGAASVAAVDRTPSARPGPRASASEPESRRTSTVDARDGHPAPDAEVVILMGIPAAGKSTHVAQYTARGYARLNRDERGGTLDGLARALDALLTDGVRRVVLDNTYAARAARARVVAVARRHDVPVRCVLLDTSLEDAQANAVGRLLDLHGRLLEPDELKKGGKRDPALLPPSAQSRWRREYEAPALDEGFAAIEVVPFVRARRPGTHRALIVELDDLVRAGRPMSPDEVVLLPGARDALHAWRAAGWRVVATSWAPAVAESAATAAAVAAAADRTRALLALDVDIAWCAHGAGPPVCWCRKPLPGLGLLLARRHDLDLAASVHVGRGAADRGFAARLGVRFLEAEGGVPPPP